MEWTTGGHIDATGDFLEAILLGAGFVERSAGPLDYLKRIPLLMMGIINHLSNPGHIV